MKCQGAYSDYDFGDYMNSKVLSSKKCRYRFLNYFYHAKQKTPGREIALEMVKNTTISVHYLFFNGLRELI